MEIGIDDIDQLDFNEPGEQQQDVTPEKEHYGDDMEYTKPWMDGTDQGYSNNNDSDNNYNSSNYDSDDDLIASILQSKGIDDPSQIKFENDNGEIESRNWSSLTPEEKYNILVTPNSSPERDLDDEEIALINDLRTRNMSPQEYMESLVNYGAQEYASNQMPTEQFYEVDGISDDELYMLDLKARTPDITDEELISALDAAKQNEDLYNKQVQGIRQEYKDLEDQRNQEQEAIAVQQQQDSFNQFANTIYDNIEGLNEVGGLDVMLDDDDKEELAEFILGNDQAGNSNLGMALNDPETLVKMSWFALKGIDTIDGMVDYFKNEIKNVRENSYRQGMLDAQKGGRIPPRVVVTQPKSTEFNQNQGEIKTIDDLD